MATDASGSWGCGAWYGSCWFQVQWDDTSRPLLILVKELLPIVLACELWGPLWTNQQILCCCDNQAVVASLRSRTSKHGHCMHMLRALAFVEAHHRFILRTVYIDMVSNHLADDLSCDNMSSFLSKVSQANRLPDHPSTPHLNLLLDPKLDWVSERWHHQFGGISERA